MALTFTLVDTWDDGQRIHVSGTVAASGSYSTGGDTLDLSQFPLIAATSRPFRARDGWTDSPATITFHSRLSHEQQQSQNLRPGRQRRSVSRTRRRCVSWRNHRRHRHILRNFQEAAVAQVFRPEAFSVHAPQKHLDLPHTVLRRGTACRARRGAWQLLATYCGVIPRSVATRNTLFV